MSRGLPPEAARATDPAIPAAPISLTKPGQRGQILLAEDNDVNQLIVTELLALAGYACDVVADGNHAVDAAMTGRYALVLMDCQMPGMDGFQATGIIRDKERADGPGAEAHSDPSALTANAISGDRERLPRGRR